MLQHEEAFVGSSSDVPRFAADGMDTRLLDHESDKQAMETDSSTPALCSDKEKTKSENLTNKMQRKKRRKREWEIGNSVRWLAAEDRVGESRCNERLGKDESRKRGQERRNGA
ncbi:hypothetical protein POM88_034163 [Heracleum sosnowskyi]|uniref:Uncharacterized protein n=1 Tax=Heracleum sosnowskyi TaxID=360622 RepID=A0AAD8MBZ1_9APIA|nr:hypothetical protein POM88_034163 [Heracleum sosnowskyi]